MADWVKAVTKCLSCACENARLHNVPVDDQQNEDATR